MLKFIKSKQFIILVAGLLVLISCIVLFFTNTEYARFKNIQDEVLTIAGEIGTGDGYFVIDTKRSPVPLEEMTTFQQSWYLHQMPKAIEAIKFANEELGFGESLYTYMAATTESMGTIKRENENYIVSWAYSLDDGLEVKYQIKKSAMYKIGGK